MKQFLFFLLPFFYACKAPEINTLQPRTCPPLHGEISYSISPDNAKNATFSLTKTSGAIHKITWVVESDSLKNNALQTTKTYSSDGDYAVTAVLLDSCGKELKLTQPLSITTYVTIPDTAFENKLLALGIDSEKNLMAKLRRVML